MLAHERLQRIAVAFGRKVQGDELRIACPAHNGDNPEALKLAIADDKILAHCHSHECDYLDIAKAIKDRAGVDLNPVKQTTRKKKVSERTWTYPNGNRSYRVDYDDGTKRIWQDKGTKAKGTPVLLFPPDGPDPVVITEGEKAAEAVQAAGLTGASYFAGAKNAGNADYSALAGRTAVIWPDDDPEGRGAAHRCYQALRRAGVDDLFLACGPDDTGSSKRDAADHPAAVIIEQVRTAQSREPEPEPDDARLSPWYEIGKRIGGMLNEQYRYTRTAFGPSWWVYTDNRWSLLPTNDPTLWDLLTRDRLEIARNLTDDGYPHLGAMLSDGLKYAQGAQRAEVDSGLRHALAGPEPRPADACYGAANGVVDLRTGKLTPHGPNQGLRAVARGRYLPDNADKGMELIRKRFKAVFSTAMLETALDMAALGASGQATYHHRQIAFVVGKSGSGKGGWTALLNAAQGEHAAGANPGWLGAKHEQDIDTTGARILESMAGAIIVNEFGEDQPVNAGFLNSVTASSGDPFRARDPYKPLLVDFVRGVFWLSAVAPPLIPANSGIRRRVTFIPTLGYDFDLDPDGISSPDIFPQDLCDALVTQICLRARRVFERGYKAPRGDEQVKAVLLDRMDPVAAWVRDMPADWDGMPASNALQLCQSDLGKEITSTLLGNRINASEVWTKERATGGEHRNKMVLRRVA